MLAESYSFAARVAGFVLIVSPTATTTLPTEQLHFSAEETQFQRPTRLPPAALRLLARDKFVRRGDPELAGPLNSWFTASIMHLNASDQADLLVMADGPLRGANVNNFWVLRPSPSGYDIVLNASAHDLLVKQTRSLGYRDIELDSATSDKIHTAFFRYDGKVYRLYRERWQPIR